MNFLETAKHLESRLDTSVITYLDFNLDPSTEDMDYPHLKLSVKNKPIELQTYIVKCNITEETIDDLKLFHSVDGEAMVNSVLESESISNRQRKIMEIYDILGEKSDDEIRSKWKKTVRRIFPKIKYKEYLVNKSTDGSRLLVSNIILRANLIGSRCRRGSGDFVICNGAIGSLIQDHPSFVYSENKVYNNTSSEIRSIGTITGNISVFIDPLKRYTDNTVVVGRKTQDNEPGVYIVENKGSREIAEFSSFKESKPVRKKSLLERLAFVSLENAEKNFLKFEVEFTKKPLWRRILFI